MRAENNAFGGSSGTQSFTVNGGSAGTFYNPPVHTLRIPSVEPYGYTEHPFSGTAEEAIAEQKRLTKIAKGEDVPGLARNDFNEILDIYITTGKIDNGDDCYGDMNRDQKLVVNEVKKAMKRVKED